MIRLNSEWDIGQEDVVFTSKRAAKAWLADNATVRDMIGPSEEFKNVAEIFDAGLFSYTELEDVG